MQRFVGLCEQAAVGLRRAYASGRHHRRVSISQFRDVRPEDLLGRVPIEIDLESVRKQIEGRVVS